MIKVIEICDRCGVEENIPLPRKQREALDAHLDKGTLALCTKCHKEFREWWAHKDTPIAQKDTPTVKVEFHKDDDGHRMPIEVIGVEAYSHPETKEERARVQCAQCICGGECNVPLGGQDCC